MPINITPGFTADAGWTIRPNNNSAPVIPAIPNQNINEGGSISLNVNATDAQTPANQLTYNLLVAPAGAAISSTGVVTWTSSAPGTQTFTVEVSDGELATTGSFSVIVAEVAPTVSAISGQITTEGTAFTPVQVVASHPTVGVTYAVEDGPGSVNSSGLWTYTPADDENSTVTIRVTRAGGTEFTDVTFPITATNVSPTIALSGDADVTAGFEYSLTLGAVSDPGTDTVTNYRVNWGDGTVDDYATPGVKTHTYASPAMVNIAVDLTDEDGVHTNAGAFNIEVVGVQGVLLHSLENPNAFGAGTNDFFGFSVDTTTTHTIVGTYFEDDAGGTSSGKAYIFNTTTGALLHTLDNPNPVDTSQNDWFGYSVGISGNRAIVGAPKEKHGGFTFAISGKAYIFDVTTGALLHTLNNPNAFGTVNNDQFGISVAISGNRAIVGANFEDDANGSARGKAYIFDVNTGALLHTLDNPNPSITTAQIEFGREVDISDSYAIVGAYLTDDAGGTLSGKAYIFDVTTGALLHTLDNPNTFFISRDDNFGQSVDISGTQVIVGSSESDSVGWNDSGVAYVFDAVTGSLRSTLVNPNPVGTGFGDQFSWSVAISGNRAVVGASGEENLSAPPGEFQNGMAYIYR